MSDLSVNRITDKALESQGFILYTDEEWQILKIDLREGATVEAIHEYLSSRGINYGIKDQRITELVEQFNNGDPVTQEVIAEGIPVQHGRDGKLDFLVEMESKKIEVSDEDGNVDFRDLNLIKEVHSGQEIIKVHPPTQGKDGMTIQNRNVTAAQGKKAKYRLGKNVRLEESNNTIYATADGHIEYVDPLVSVSEEFVVNKDVDFTIGNLKFIGNLTINGAVPNGYTMEAGKDIFIKGVCTGSDLIAKGNITIENGIVGTENTKIVCDGKLKAKFVNEATIEAKGGIEIYYEIVRSVVKTMGKLFLENGAIRGGETYAFDGLKAKEIGAPLGTPTMVAVGVDFSVDQRIEKLNAATEQLQTQMKKYQEAVEPFTKNKFLLLKAPEAKKSAVKTILNKIEGIKKKMKQIEQMISGQESGRYNRTKEVEINGAILDDVTIQIGNKKKKFDKFGKRKGVILYDKASFEIVFSRRT